MSRVARFFQRAGDVLLSAGGRRWWRTLGWALVVLLALNVVVSCYWSREPAVFEVDERAEVEGELLAGTLLRVTETLWEKPGGYLSNDLLPHRLWLIRMPNWEQGVLAQSRDLVRTLERDLARPPGNEGDLDDDLTRARSQLFFDAHSWAMPNSRREFERGTRALRAWLERLRDGADDTYFHHRDTQALDAWLAEVEHRLNDLSLRLSQSVGRPVAYTRMSEDHDGEETEKTPRMQVGAIFYEARGSAWALLHLMQAMEIEFADLLHRHRAEVPVRRLIRELEATQQPVRSPMILNSSGFGMLANHSLVMGNYISRAQAAVVELRLALE